MANTARSKKKTQKSIILRIALIAFFVYGIGSFTMIQVDIAHSRDDLDQVEEQYKEQVYLNEKLTALLNSGENKDYVEKIARETLGYAFPNERVIVDYKSK